MSATYFAKVENGIVTTVHVVSYDFIVANPDRYGDPDNWIETFLDGSQNGKYAGIGDLWNGTEFVAPVVEEAP
jgi:hypothetical protein